MGHTGLSTAKIFDDLDKLQISDTFSIYYLNEKLDYQICNIKVISPTETQYLQIQENEDLITLVTCTPKYINTHRLCVTAKRMLEEKNDIDDEKIETQIEENNKEKCKKKGCFVT